ncbi:MAG: hypothetical protein WBX00_26885 [Isosphaeraceae bacterium]
MIGFNVRLPRCPRRLNRAARPTLDVLEVRALLSTSAVKLTASTQYPTSVPELPPGTIGYDPSTNPDQLLTTSDVKALLERAAAAVDLNDAIIAVVDRNGTILGVRVESGVSPQITGNTTNLVFAIDGAVSEARTGAYFSNDTAPLTSRTIQDISQTTITQRVVDSNPDVPDPNGDSTLYGPGYVAAVGIKGHFPPGIMFTPQVDLFDIEGTNRDSLSPVTHTRFNVPSQYIPPGASLVAPESYGQVTGLLPTAQSRGIGTLPGGVPLYKTVNGKTALVGGIGVFFPGTTGYATEENSKLNTPLLYNPHKLDLSEVAEYMAFVAAGGSKSAGLPFSGPVNNAPALPDFTEPFGRIDLAGITLDIFGGGGLEGPKNLLNFGATLGAGNANDGTDMPVDKQGDTYLAGQGVPYGWLVTPHAGGGLTATDVEAIVARGITEANQVRAQIRLPLNNTARMSFAVSDENGNILGLYRMQDADYFSIGVAVAKARNVAYYDNASQLQPSDEIKGIPPGTALTTRTIRYLSLPFFPEGIDIDPPGPGSILTDGGVTKYGTNKGAPLPASAFQSLQGYADFNPNSNFHDPYNKANQNGVVFFPGSTPLYKDATGSGLRSQLVAGLGVSGDGVLEDDDVTSNASIAFAPSFTIHRADQVKLRGVRLPYFKYNRNPHVPLNGEPVKLQPIIPPAPTPRKKNA